MLGLHPLTRHDPAGNTPPLVIEESGLLPELSPVTAGIITREDIDAEELKPIIAVLKAIFCRATISDKAVRSILP